MSTAAPSKRIGSSPQQTVRRQNLATILREIAEDEPVSRAGLAQRTGLTRGTVSSLVEELLEAGLVTELAAARGGTGRPANPLQLNRSGPAGLGIEIGVDEIGACVVDLAGEVRALRRAPSEHRSQHPRHGLDRATQLANEVIAEAGLDIDGAGVALPGLVGPDGVLQRAPNLPLWVDVAVDADLASRLGTPVEIANEADLAALAELWFDDGPQDFVHVSGGIGVGAGIVLGGELFRGPGGRAGELGHVVVEPDGPSCSCGGHGCLEQLAGRTALLRLSGTTDTDEFVASPGPAISAAGRALGIALSAAINLLDIPTVVLGGLYARLGPPLANALTAELRDRVPSRPDIDVRLGTPGAGGALRAAGASVVRRRLRNP
jgi:predicted NBD/HSP70 family sugar kinase/biotin operon repressor